MRLNNNKYILGVAVITGLFFSSCKLVTKTYQSPVVSNASQQRLFRDSSVVGGDTTSLAVVPWREIFSDPQLQQLIAEGLRNNLDLKSAIEQITIAGAGFKQSKAAFLPTLSFSPSVTQAKSSEAGMNLPANIGINLKTTTYQMAFSSSWEVDIWGKLASSKRAAYATLLQSDAAKRAVQTQLIADIANYYYYLLALDKQLAITLKTIANRKEDVASMKELKEAAVVNGAAVVQSEANLHAAEVTLPDIRQNIRETEHTICLLLGREPGAVERTSLETQKVYTGLHTGIPMQLLHNRPDVEAAELSFRNTFENTNVARTSFYPSLAITSASAGLSALTLDNLFSKSIFYSVAGGLTQPILNKGANRANLKTAEANQRIALNSFYKTLLTAGQEVSNAIYKYQAGVDKELSRNEQIVSLEQAVDYTKELLQYSSATNYTDVLTSEQSLLSAQISGVDDRLQQLQAVVALYHSLGGGWRE